MGHYFCIFLFTITLHKHKLNFIRAICLDVMLLNQICYFNMVHNSLRSCDTLTFNQAWFSQTSSSSCCLDEIDTVFGSVLKNTDYATNWVAYNLPCHIWVMQSTLCEQATQLSWSLFAGTQDLNPYNSCIPLVGLAFCGCIEL